MSARKTRRISAAEQLSFPAFAQTVTHWTAKRGASSGADSDADALPWVSVREPGPELAQLLSHIAEWKRSR